MDYQHEFVNCILGSFESVENLARKVKSYLDTIQWEESASIIFEMVPIHPHSGLTVDYGRYHTPHLSTIYYHDSKVHTKLPDDISGKFFEGVAVTEIPCNSSDIAKYYYDKMQEALAGKFEDLEGFMVAFTNDDNELLYVKLKFPWYFAAHKPDTNFLAAEDLSFNPIYDIIRHKLVNLSASSEKREARRNPEKCFEPFARIMATAIYEFNATHNPVNKKEFMTKYREHSAFFSNYENINDAIMSALAKLCISLDYSIVKLVPSLWDHVIGLDTTVTPNVTQFISEFIMKAWNIKTKF